MLVFGMQYSIVQCLVISTVHSSAWNSRVQSCAWSTVQYILVPGEQYSTVLCLEYSTVHSCTWSTVQNSPVPGEQYSTF